MRKLGIVLVVVVAVAIVVMARSRSEEKPPPPPQPVRAPRRDTGIVKATGVLRPMIGAEVRVGSRISGVVRRLHVRVGDRVEKGQQLAELDDRDLRARKREARAALELAQANVDYARSDLQRKRELRTNELLAPSELELAQRAYAVAQQQHAGARASLDAATTQLGYTLIAAPIAGVVASVSTQEGETVAASFATPMFVTLVDLSRLEVWTYVDETDIGRIRIGQKATFTVDTYDDTAFAGRVSAIYPKAEIRDNVVNYVAVVTFDAPRDRTLRPEMTATVRVETSDER